MPDSIRRTVRPPCKVTSQTTWMQSSGRCTDWAYRPRWPLSCGRAAAGWVRCGGTGRRGGSADTGSSAHVSRDGRYWSTDCYPADGHGQMSAVSVRRADGRCRRSPGGTIVAPSRAFTRYARYVALPAGHAYSRCREASRQVLWRAADYIWPGTTAPLPQQCRPEIRSIGGPAAQGGE